MFRLGRSNSKLLGKPVVFAESWLPRHRSFVLVRRYEKVPDFLHRIEKRHFRIPGISYEVANRLWHMELGVIIAIFALFGIYKYYVVRKDTTDTLIQALEELERQQPDYCVPVPGNNVPLHLIFNSDEGYPIKCAVAFQFDDRVWEATKSENVSYMGFIQERIITWSPLPIHDKERVYLSRSKETITHTDSSAPSEIVNEEEGRLKWIEERRYKHMVKGVTNRTWNGYDVVNGVYAMHSTDKERRTVVIRVKLSTVDNARDGASQILYEFVHESKVPMAPDEINQVRNWWVEQFSRLASREPAPMPASTNEEQKEIPKIEELETPEEKEIKSQQEQNQQEQPEFLNKE